MFGNRIGAVQLAFRGAAVGIVPFGDRSEIDGCVRRVGRLQAEDVLPGAGAALGLLQTIIGAASAATPFLFALAVSATSLRVAFSLLLVCPLAAYGLFGAEIRRAAT